MWRRTETPKSRLAFRINSWMSNESAEDGE